MHLRAAFPFISLALVLATAPAARTAPGDLDQTFGGDGVVRTDLSPAEDDGFAVAIQPDGKIVVGGVKGNAGPNPRFAIVRYATDGSLDPSFGGGDGQVFIDITPGADFVYIVRIQTAGKIVVAGPAAYFGRNSRFALARLTSDGSLDPTLGGDGTVVTDLTPSYDYANGMALQPKIVVVGSVSAGPDNGKIGVLRYRSDGSLDPGFGGDGIVLADPTPTYDDGLAIGVEADGQIVVAGGAGFDGPNERFVVLAYEPDGSLDPTFGGDGKVITDVTPKPDVPFALAIQDDGKIVVAGGAALGEETDPKFVLVRYRRDGSLDTSFKGDGTVTTNFTPHDDGAYSVAIDLDGRIVAAGLAGNDGRAPRFALARYLADGTLDATFGGDGKVTTDFTRHFDSAWGVAVLADGSVVCPGVAGLGGPNPSLAVLRYQP